LSEVSISSLPEPTGRGFDVVAVRAELMDLLGQAKVRDDPRILEKASVDWAKMSPILLPKLPDTTADLVVYPESVDDVQAVVGVGVTHQVPMTVRGKGTGNYGQAIPLRGGIVIDMSGVSAVEEIGADFIEAGAGARMIDLENAARKTGKELWMYPSTIGSALGGFLAGGSGGTGSIRYGSNLDGFVQAVEIVHAISPVETKRYENAETAAFLHAYGTTGIIAKARVGLTHATDWCGVYATFSDYAAAAAALQEIGARTDPWPRLVSLDEAALAAALPKDAAMPAGLASLRSIIDESDLSAVISLIEKAGGEVADVRRDGRAGQRISAISYNHSTHFLQQSKPEYFHLEVLGPALVTAQRQLRAAIPGLLVHLEASQNGPLGMLMTPYAGEQAVYDVIRLLHTFDLQVHSPHNWYVDRDIEQAQRTAATTDPLGLLNPGKLVDVDIYRTLTGMS
jgi:FAD/FMN-containing dehydrogenase